MTFLPHRTLSFNALKFISDYLEGNCRQKPSGIKLQQNNCVIQLQIDLLFVISFPDFYFSQIVIGNRHVALSKNRTFLHVPDGGIITVSVQIIRPLYQHISHPSALPYAFSSNPSSFHPLHPIWRPTSLRRRSLSRTVCCMPS